jgi:uracil-DNA glycosylase
MEYNTLYFLDMSKTKQYWVDKLGEEWAMRLKETLKSPYMDKLMNFLAMQYAMQRIHPHEANIFKKLKEIPIEKIRVVILTKEPGINASNFKLPYADNYIDCMHNISYHKINDCIAKEYCKDSSIYLQCDHDFDSWESQGVVHLHTSFTVLGEETGSHLRPWNQFITALLRSFVQHDPGIIFFLWGEEAKAFSPLLTNQHVFTWECPSVAAQENRDWNCPNFKQANNLIEKLYGGGDSFKIKW